MVSRLSGVMALCCCRLWHSQSVMGHSGERWASVDWSHGVTVQLHVWLWYHCYQESWLSAAVDCDSFAAARFVLVCIREAPGFSVSPGGTSVMLGLLSCDMSCPGNHSACGKNNKCKYLNVQQSCCEWSWGYSQLMTWLWSKDRSKWLMWISTQGRDDLWWKLIRMFLSEARFKFINISQALPSRKFGLTYAHFGNKNDMIGFVDFCPISLCVIRSNSK